MGFLITALILLTIALIACIISIKEEGNYIIGVLICIISGAVLINNVTTSCDKPVKIPMSKISILIDDEIAIIRYGDVIETYDNVKEYKAIRDSSFKFMETRERNVFGVYNGSTYKLIIK